MATQSSAAAASASESGKTTDGDASLKEGIPNDISPASVFVNSQPIREDQVQNAVQFLSHQKVRGSPVIHRRNFLERKGLTKEEIDEAFRRVPDPSPDFTSTQATNSNQVGQVKPSSNIQQTPVQALQPGTAAPPSGVVSTVTRRFHWSHAFLAIGFLAASGAGTAIFFRKAIIPRLKFWIRKVAFDHEDNVDKGAIPRPSLAEEAAAAAKAAAAAAADVAKASQEMLITKREERKCFQEFMSLLDVQLQEIKSMRNAMQKLEGLRPQAEEENLGSSFIRSKVVDATTESDSRSVRSSSPAAPAEPLHPKSYMEIMAMVQRGEKPPNIREINDLPPNPNQQISNPSLAPRTKPWEVSNHPPNGSSFAPLPPFKNEGSSLTTQTNGASYHINGDSSVPWWQQQQQKNARITEIETEDSFSMPSNGTAAIDRPPQRKWVPPQAPPVALPEAAIAIRQPKSTPARDRVLEKLARPIDGVDGLERMSVASESGEQEDNGVGLSIESASEIQEEEVTV